MTIEQVERIFGKRVANLLTGASEPDHLRKGKDVKTSWWLRKQHTIEFVTREATLELSETVNEIFFKKKSEMSPLLLC